MKDGNKGKTIEKNTNRTETKQRKRKTIFSKCQEISQNQEILKPTYGRKDDGKIELDWHLCPKKDDRRTRAHLKRDKNTTWQNN